jgi:hypothetical protein
MSLKGMALEGPLERLKGGRATRMQAIVSGLAAAAVVYKLLRSGADDEEKDEAEEDEAEKDEAAKSPA